MIWVHERYVWDAQGSLKGNRLRRSGTGAKNDPDNLPAPELIACEIVEDPTDALVEFEAGGGCLEKRAAT